MAKQFHYVVMYDEGTKEFYIDWDVTDVNLDSDRGTIFDTKTEEWTACAEDEQVEERYRDMSDILADALADYNRVRNEEA